MNWSEWIKPSNVFVVVGVSQDTSKWGYRVWKHLKLRGFTALPVNPKYGEVEGEKCYADLEAVVQAHPDTLGVMVVITVVPPEVTKKVVHQAERLGITRVWMQPGSEELETVRRLDGSKVRVVAGKCIVRDGLGEAFLV